MDDDMAQIMACETYEDAQALATLQFLRDFLPVMTALDCEQLGVHEGPGDTCLHCGAPRSPGAELWSVEDKVRQGFGGIVGG